MRKAEEMATSTVDPEPAVENRDRSLLASSSRSVPVCNWRAHWLTAQEFARVMGRRPQTVYAWLRDGTLAEFGIPTYQLRCGRPHSGRIFIQNIF